MKSFREEKYAELDRLKNSLTSRMYELVMSMEGAPKSALASYWIDCVSFAHQDRDIRLLRTFDRLVTIDCKPLYIKRAIAAMNGDRHYHPDRVPDHIYDEISPERVIAFETISKAQPLMGHPLHTEFAGEAVKNPEITERLMELLNRGYTDFDKTMEAINGLDLGVSVPLQEGSL